MVTTKLNVIIDQLVDFEKYLETFPPEERSSRFEYIIAEGFSRIFNLPLLTTEQDDKTRKHRIIWNGKIDERKTMPKFERIKGPDAYIYAHEFTVLLEATLKVGYKQWSQEYARAIEHYTDFTKTADKQSCYLFFIPTELYQDSYTAIKQKCSEKCHYVILPLANFITILKTYELAFTASHIDLRQLLIKVIHCCEWSEDKDDFLTRINTLINDWQNKILRSEKYMFLSIKSYVRLVKGTKRYASLSEIYSDLSTDDFVRRYYSTLGTRFVDTDIIISLERERLAYEAENIPDDKIFCAVPIYDVKARVRTFIQGLGV